MNKTFKRLFMSVKVLDNRVEIVEGMIPFRKRTVIPFRNIANVEVAQFTKRLVIQTNDGKAHKLSIGGFSKAQAAAQAIVEAM